jgi:hypothetical protein
MSFRPLFWSLVTLAAASPAIRADIPNPALYPEESNRVCEVEGMVQAIDAERQLVTLRDVRDHDYTVRILKETAISDSEHAFMSLTDLRPRDRIRVYYTTFDMGARQVDRVTPHFPANLFPA